MTDIVELVRERRREAVQQWRDDLKREAQKFMLECLHRNLRDVANDPDDFPELEEETMKPFGLEYWITGGWKPYAV